MPKIALKNTYASQLVIIWALSSAAAAIGYGAL